MKNKVIFCDFDGVIIDNSDKLYSIYRDLMKEKRILSKIEYWNLKKIKIPEEEIIKKTFNNENFIQGYMEKRKDMIEDEKFLEFDRLIANSIESIKKLKENNKVILLTKRKNKNNLFTQLRKMKILNIFDEILVSGTVSKKDLILKSSLFAKDQSVIVGDTEEEISVGKNLGIQTIAVLTGLRARKFLENYKPDLIIESINDIRTCLKK
ncbi:HAD family hydrolase [Candidatus Woesearchaeota archaeon]|nr:HAD family hydrolase [Candidatus Woesearchaeota archaeon]